MNLQRRISPDDIESRMCKALYDMPGDQAVEAVERFAMVDLDKVRSKTGFMVRQSVLDVSSNLF